MNTKNIFRTLFMAVLLLVGANSAKADETLYEGEGKGEIQFPLGAFDNANPNDFLQITYTVNELGNQWYTPPTSIDIYGWKPYDFQFAKSFPLEVKEGTFTTEIQLDSWFFDALNTDVDHNWISAKISGSNIVISKVVLVSAADTSKPLAITVDKDIKNGSISVAESAYKDDEVTITAIADAGYKLKHFLVNGNAVEPSGNAVEQEDGTIKYTGTFTMPAKAVTVSAEFIDQNIVWQGKQGKVTISASDFINVSADATLRVWSEKLLIKVKVGDNNGEKLFYSENQEVVLGSDLDQYYKSYGNYFEFTLTEEMLDKLAASGLYLELNWGNSPITQVMLISGTAAPKHTLTIIVDGAATTKQVAEGTLLSNILEAYEKTGYTLEWDNLPEDGKMPENDLELTAVYTPNIYTLTYILDGEVYAEEGYEYEAEIEPLEIETEEGYMFSGWSGLPETMPAKDVTVTGYTSQYVTAEITSSTGFATFCSDKALDFSKVKELKAYYATTIDDEEGVVVFKQIRGKVAASTGLLLMGEEGTEVYIPVVDEGTECPRNLLNCGPATANSADEYVLVEKDGEAKFADTAGNAATVPAGKAYLKASANSNSRILTFSFADGTTGISAATTAEKQTSGVYNLKGQRVTTPGKGLYIINGKKVVIK